MDAAKAAEEREKADKAAKLKAEEVRMCKEG